MPSIGWNNVPLEHAIGHLHDKPVGNPQVEKSTEEPLAESWVERQPVGDSDDFGFVLCHCDSLNAFKIPAKIAGNQAAKHEGERLHVRFNNSPEKVIFEFFRAAIKPFAINRPKILIASD